MPLPGKPRPQTRSNLAERAHRLAREREAPHLDRGISGGRLRVGLAVHGSPLGRVGAGRVGVRGQTSLQVECQSDQIALSRESREHTLRAARAGCTSWTTCRSTNCRTLARLYKRRAPSVAAPGVGPSPTVSSMEATCGAQVRLVDAPACAPCSSVASSRSRSPPSSRSPRWRWPPAFQPCDANGNWLNVASASSTATAAPPVMTAKACN